MENIKNTTLESPPIIVPFDPNKVNALTWFNGDAKNLNTWCSLLFDNAVDISHPEIVSIVNASKEFLLQLQDDINVITNFLKQYEVPNDSK